MSFLTPDHLGSDSIDLCSSESPETMIIHETPVSAVSGCLESTSEGSGGEVKPLSSSDPANSGTNTSTAEGDDDKTKKLLYCALCKVSVNSLSQLEAHNKGKARRVINSANIARVDNIFLKYLYGGKEKIAISNVIYAVAKLGFINSYAA